MDEKKTRNLQIYKKKERGQTYRSLALEYGLGAGAVYNIVRRERTRERLKGLEE